MAGSIGFVGLVVPHVMRFVRSSASNPADCQRTVGLVVPHVMRFLFGPLHRTLLIASALAGAMMVLADIASRVLIARKVCPSGW